MWSRFTEENVLFCFFNYEKRLAGEGEKEREREREKERERERDADRQPEKEVRCGEKREKGTAEDIKRENGKENSSDSLS